MMASNVIRFPVERRIVIAPDPLKVIRLSSLTLAERMRLSLKLQRKHDRHYKGE